MIPGQRVRVGDGIADTDALHAEVGDIDAEIVRLVKRRSEVSQAIGAVRMAAGVPRRAHSVELAELARFRELGTEGRELGLLLLRLARAKIGRSGPG